MAKITTATLLALSLLAGCASIPQPLRGDYAAIEPKAAQSATQTVRWGGRVIDVLPGATQTCLDILGMPLDASARPRDLDADIGRFRACKSGFLDPAVFISGREVTIVGEIDQQVEQQIGEYRYRMAQVRVTTLFLWPQRPDIENIRIHASPLFGPYGWWPVPVIHYPTRRNHRPAR